MTALEEYKAIWLKLNGLWYAEQGESEEADRLRDEADGPWYRMTHEERDQLRQWLRERRECSPKAP